MANEDRREQRSLSIKSCDHTFILRSQAFLLVPPKTTPDRLGFHPTTAAQDTPFPLRKHPAFRGQTAKMEPSVREHRRSVKVGRGGKVVVKQPNSTGQKGYGWRTMLSKYSEIGGPCRGRTYGPLIKSAIRAVFLTA
jgi:hypothetical protein